ncbi:MAG: hypothetical protein COA34_014890 [Methylophaga sp.]|uniref:hypothetical protein n=1 Tax=Methylophaga sp. TaxID=2024840 RepID=UPI00216E5313|nr:hypothetical protein [Methylophaga sp.]MBL1459120.1 hypothetical protein [Methylophaga sp.]
MPSKLSYKKYYSELFEKQVVCRELSLEKHGDDIARMHQTIEDVSAIFSVAISNPEGFVYTSVLYDMGLSLFFAISGQYRQSYIAQRAVLENSIGALFYSAHLLQLKKWTDGQLDISWKKVSQGDGGVFTLEFSEAFCPLASSRVDEYSGYADDLYSNLSDFVHKHISVHDYDSKNFTYNEVLFKKVVTSFELLARVISFVFCVRYFDTFGPSLVEEIEFSIEAVIGEVGAFQNAKKKGIV